MDKVKKEVNLMNRILLISLIILSALAQRADAKSGGPVASGPLAGYWYYDSDPTAVPFIPVCPYIAATPNWLDGTLTNERVLHNFINGFQFPFPLGTPYTSCMISDDGYIAFNTTSTTNPTGNNAQLPTTLFSYPVICAFWDNLIVPTGSNYDPYPPGLVTAGYVSAPNALSNTENLYVITWQDVMIFGAPQTLMTFSIVLQSDGVIYLQYSSLINGALLWPYFGDPVDGRSATIGIQGSTTSALQYSFNLIGALGTPNQSFHGRCIKFMPCCPAGTLTPTQTYTSTPTWNPTYPTYTLTPTITLTPSSTSSSTRTATRTRTSTHTFTVTRTRTSTSTYTHTVTDWPTNLPTYTHSHTLTATYTRTRTRTRTITLTPSITRTRTLTRTRTDTKTLTISRTPTITKTFTETRTLTDTVTPTFTETLTPSPTQVIPHVVPNPLKITETGDTIATFVFPRHSSDERIEVDIYNSAGMLIASVQEETENMWIPWNAADVAPGVYIWRMKWLSVDGGVVLQKFVGKLLIQR